MKTFIAAISFGLIVGLIPASPVNAAPYCGITWGSLPKTASDTGATEQMITNVRTGRHDCYDRMVIDTTASGTGYDVRYVSNVYADGSGQLIPLSGGAKLQIVAQAPSYNPSTGVPTYGGITGNPLPGVNLAGYQTFRDAKFAGSFEGQSTIGLGVRAQLPFRVMKFDNRVIVDVAHKW
ncbi:hypothetical protein PV379_01370 [Streptomyces caniscabiei]|uniref:AMIN-like domain-containing (lipo)protein n=1 Tax=Streptomyces caniscabiei TaxID=2746961 RepID=UPI0029A6E587|nr:hypothetical protein [Streptomyces caniscabiei]MDX2776003.1 hypothetical protein [Streptomyces caniscabiei]